MLHCILFLLEISGYAGYQTNSHINGDNGRFRQIGGDLYGGSISYPINEDIRIKLGYSRMTSFVEFESYYPALYRSWSTEAFQEFYSIGTEKPIQLSNEKLVPYGTFLFGFSRYKALSGNKEEDYLFTVDLGAGVKYYLSKIIGIQIEAKAQLPMKFDGIYFSYGTGGAGSGAYSRAMIQGVFTGGIFLQLGGN